MKCFDVECWPYFYYKYKGGNQLVFCDNIRDFDDKLKLKDNYVKQFRNHLFYIDNISKITGHKLKHIFRKDFERIVK